MNIIASIENTKVGSVLIHRYDGGKTWQEGKRIGITKIEKNSNDTLSYYFEVIDGSYVDPDVTYFVSRGIEDFWITEEMIAQDDQLIAAHNVILQCIAERIEKRNYLSREIVQLEKEIDSLKETCNILYGAVNG